MPSDNFTDQSFDLIDASGIVSFTVPSLPFNITWTVAITILVFPPSLTFSLCTLPPEILVSPINTLLIVGSGIVSASLVSPGAFLSGVF